MNFKGDYTSISKVMEHAATQKLFRKSDRYFPSCGEPDPPDTSCPHSPALFQASTARNYFRLQARNMMPPSYIPLNICGLHPQIPKSIADCFSTSRLGKPHL